MSKLLRPYAYVDGHKVQNDRKSILALIPSERPVRPVVDGSVVLAMACHAHLNALAIGYESTNIPIAAIASPLRRWPPPESSWSS
jgi:formate dehydrogenase assembly factor FdhD